jgi:hypothetical protein
MKKQMKKPSIQIRDYRFKLSPIAVACATTLSGFLVLSSVAQASDMQIYASPTAGQKTIVMMLDTSGLMVLTNIVTPLMRTIASVLLVRMYKLIRAAVALIHILELIAQSLIPLRVHLLIKDSKTSVITLAAMVL